jgi:hypothetical protein
MHAQSKIYLQALTTFVRAATSAVCFFSTLTALGKPQSMADSLERLRSLFPGPDDIKPPREGQGGLAQICFYGQLNDTYQTLYTQLRGMFCIFCTDFESYPATSEQITGGPKRCQKMAQVWLTAAVKQASEATVQALSALE